MNTLLLYILFFNTKPIHDFSTFRFDDHCCYKTYQLGLKKFEIQKFKYYLIGNKIYLYICSDYKGPVYICLTNFQKNSEVVCSKKVVGEKYINDDEFILSFEIDEIDNCDIILTAVGHTPIIFDLHYNN